MVPLQGIPMDALYLSLTTRLRYGRWGELTKGNGLRAETGAGEMGFAGIRVPLCHPRSGGCEEGRMSQDVLPGRQAHPSEE